MLTIIMYGCGETTGSEQPAPTVDLNPTDPLEQGARFVDTKAYRRKVLRESIVDPDNGYSALRLANYAHTRKDTTSWDDTPIWNPDVRKITTQDIGRFANAPYQVINGPFAPAYDGVDEWTHEALLALGKDAFERFPLQTDMASGHAISSTRAVEESGVWIDKRNHVGGLVRVRRPEGDEVFSKTCATCHASPNALGQLIHGRSHASFDLGKLITYQWPDWLEAGTWGPGQVDVTSDAMNNPAAIIDLRPIRYQKRLHWAATLHNSLPALAVRVDTLIITSLGKRKRPPREVSFAIAYYLWHLGAPPETSRALTADELAGKKVFKQQCSACHKADGTTGEPIALDIIGTDPAVGESTSRGTGAYRVPSLWKVADRTQLFHHGKVRSLSELLDPTREDRVKGHPFGLTITEQERETLIAFLKTIGNREP